MILNDDEGLQKVFDYDYSVGGAYDANFFNPVFFDTGLKEMDYKVLNIYEPVRWIRFIFKNTKGLL